MINNFSFPVLFWFFLIIVFKYSFHVHWEQVNNPSLSLWIHLPWLRWKGKEEGISGLSGLGNTTTTQMVTFHGVALFPHRVLHSNNNLTNYFISEEHWPFYRYIVAVITSVVDCLVNEMHSPCLSHPPCAGNSPSYSTASSLPLLGS